MLTEIQKNIIDLLKAYPKLTLAQISSRLSLNKSSVLYQLEILSDLKIIHRDKKSKKTIFYSVSSKNVLEQYISNKTTELENILLSKPIEGLSAYIELLNKVAAGTSDIYGYANLERKVIPELKEVIENFRDTVSAKNRFDRFCVTNRRENLELLKDHHRKPNWAKYLLGKVVEKEVLDVNCDIYTWDNIAGICSFENGGFKVEYITDFITANLLRSLLKNLWDNTLDS